MTRSGRAATLGGLARDRNYAALWLGQFVSIFGDRFTYLALLAVIVAKAAHPENAAPELSFLPLASFLPTILFGPWIGALVDRSDTRRVLIVSDAARGLAVLAMIPATNAGGLPALFALVFLLYLANTFFLPARSAIMPLLVPAAVLTEANSLATFAGVAATIAGSLVAGYLIDRFGWAWGFAIDALTYFVSVIFLWRIRLDRRGRSLAGAEGEKAEGASAGIAPGAERSSTRSAPTGDPEDQRPKPYSPSAPNEAASAPNATTRYRKLGADIREGFSILLRTPSAWWVTLAVMTLWMAGGVLHVAVPVLANRGGAVAGGVGVLLASVAVGMVVGTLGLALRGGGSPRLRLAIGLLVTGVGLALFTLRPQGPAAWAAAFVAGVFVALLLVTTETALQEAIAPEARGRVFALRDMAARIAVLATAGAAGWLVSGGLPPRAAVQGAALLLGVVGLAGLVVGGRRGTMREGAA